MLLESLGIHTFRHGWIQVLKHAVKLPYLACPPREWQDYCPQLQGHPVLSGERAFSFQGVLTESPGLTVGLAQVRCCGYRRVFIIEPNVEHVPVPRAEDGTAGAVPKNFKCC